MRNQINNKINKLFLSILFLMLISFVFFDKANAASLSLLPSPSTVNVGNIVSMKVYVSTDSKTINNAEATIEFPVDMLEVMSITKSSSIFSLWVEEPSFSNTSGRITFNGGVPNPGYTGQSGYVASITFKAKKQGTASVIFSNGAVRANDGLGTDILISKNSGVIQISSIKEVEVPAKTPVKAVDKSITLTKFFTPVTRFENSQVIVKLGDKNSILSIDYYTIQVDNAPSFKVKVDQLINGEYYLPMLNEGNHSLTVVSFDKTGKYSESVLTFISPTISTPILSLSSKEITTGDSVIIYGKTDYPDKQENVVLEYNGNEIKRYLVTTGEDGSFSVSTEQIKTLGLISIWSETVFGGNIKSPASEKIYLKVNDTAVVKVTLAILYPLLGLIIILALLIILFVTLYTGWHKFFGLKKKINKELEQTEQDVHKAMLLLKEELGDQLKTLEKVKIERNLNEKEEIIFSEIQKNIDGLDDFIEKKLKKLI